MAIEIFITISISSAPALTASSASNFFTTDRVAPNGKPITVQTLTSEPLSILAANGTKYGFTHTEANLYSNATGNATITVSVGGFSCDIQIRVIQPLQDLSLKDFTGVELQTMDTTGTVWPERQRLLNEHGFPVDRADIENRKPFGMNWKMTAKTILIQMHHKSETFEYLNKHLVLIIQKPFFDYINREFSFSHIQGARIGDPVHIHSYDFKETARPCLKNKSCTKE